MTPDRPDRIPDAIEPLIGFRAWFFSVVGQVSVLSISAGVPGLTSAWDGANRHWVTATCPTDTIGRSHVAPASLKRQLEAIRSKIGSLPEGLFVPHSVPGEYCSCGFYAMKTLLSVEEPSGPNVILGRVELAGKVIECSTGFRAERARIVELTPVVGTEREAMRLANHLGLPMTAPVAPWSVRGRHIWRD
jgi:hypothetical protein